MEPVDLAELDAWSCIYCFGHWVEHQTLENLVKKSNPENESIELPLFSNMESLVPGKRKCPICSDSNLHIVNLENIELDVCISCNGIFFDDGELELLAGEIPEKEGMSPLGWVLIAVAARLALGGLSSV
jgi:Zn-finger nucleic acid-binding protein